MLSLLFDGVRKCCESLFVAAEQMRFPAASTVAEKILFAGLGSVGLYFTDSVIAVAIAYVSAHVISQIVSYLLLRAKLNFKSGRFEYMFFKDLAQRAFPFFGISLLAALYANIDRLFLFSMAGTGAVGIYAAAYRLVSVPTYISAAFHQAVFPSLSRHAGLSDQTRLNEAVGSCMRYLTFAAVPIAIGVTALADPMIRLIYGSAYSSGALALQILIWAYALEFFNPFFSRVLFALERQGVVMKAAVIGTGVNIGLNIVLIPRFSFVGAAVATLASAGLIFFMLYIAIRRLFPVALSGTVVLKAVLSGMLMWVILLVLNGMALVYLLCIGAGVYSLGLVLTRAISLGDIPTFFRTPQKR
jgi:O-antigen/teichoic acid export membrane protein